MKKYFYHATSKKALLDIAKNGFEITNKKNFKDANLTDFGKDKIFFTTNINDAIYYGIHGAWKREKSPYVLIRILYEENDLIKDTRPYMVFRRKNNYDYYSTTNIKVDMQVTLITDDYFRIKKFNDETKPKKRIWHNLTPELALKFKNNIKLKDLIKRNVPVSPLATNQLKG